MKIIGLLMVLPALFWTAGDPLFGCTIFKATNGDITLVGNNEDWSETETKVWFLTPEKDRYGRVYFGFKNGYAQGGMNDQGLFFDWVAGFKSDWKEDPNKKWETGSLAELILERASTVEEALVFYKIYNERALRNARIFLADRTGDSAIVGFEKGDVKIFRSEGGIQALGYGYKIASQMLQKPDALSVDSFFNILKASMQRFRYPTQYSNVYDLKRGVVYLRDFRRKTETIKFNLEEELKKGNHYYDIPKIEEQLDKPLMRDGKTLVPVKVDPSILEEYVGVYRINPELTFTVTVKDGQLYGQVQGNTPKSYRAASATKFFLTFWDQQILFLRDEKNKVAKLRIVSFDGGDDTAVKIE